ncbi:MAG: CBS domain-containing protein, partial [Gemmatimonadaceae bacterium]
PLGTELLRVPIDVKTNKGNIHGTVPLIAEPRWITERTQKLVVYHPSYRAHWFLAKSHEQRGEFLLAATSFLRLAELFPEGRCLVPMMAPTIADAALQLAQLLENQGLLANHDRLVERIEEARAEDIIGIADRAFILHYRTDAAKDFAAAIGVAPKPLRRDLGDSDEFQIARIVALIVAPPKLAARNLQFVGSLARFLANPARVTPIAQATSARELSSLPELVSWTIRPELTVRDLMSRSPRTIDPDTPIRAAVLDMVRSGVGALPVVDETNRVVGLLSERELLRHLLSHYLPRAGGNAPSPPPATAKRTVRDVMTRQVLCVAPEQPLAEVASLMLNKDVDRVPVVKNGTLVGFLTRGDIVRKLIGT